MGRGPNFIEREVFTETLAQVSTVDGATYQADTPYGDMSRLVVAWLARTSPKELQRLYNKLGWQGNCTVQALHRAAKKWFELHHPEKAVLPLRIPRLVRVIAEEITDPAERAAMDRMRNRLKRKAEQKKKA